MRRLFILSLVCLLGISTLAVPGCSQKRADVPETVKGEAADPLKVNEQMVTPEGKKASNAENK